MVRSCDPLKVWGSNHVTGTAEPKVVKFCTQVGYISSSNRMTYHQQKGRGYSHVTVLKFCCLLWCSASHGFVSDSWATCIILFHVLFCYTVQNALHCMCLVDFQPCPAVRDIIKPINCAYIWHEVLLMLLAAAVYVAVWHRKSCGAIHRSWQTCCQITARTGACYSMRMPVNCSYDQMAEWYMNVCIFIIIIFCRGLTCSSRVWWSSLSMSVDVILCQ